MNQSQALFIAEIYFLWEKDPKLPFGKFIYRALRNGTDLYFLTNEELLQLLQKEYDNG